MIEPRKAVRGLTRKINTYLNWINHFVLYDYFMYMVTVCVHTMVHRFYIFETKWNWHKETGTRQNLWSKLFCTKVIISQHFLLSHTYKPVNLAASAFALGGFALTCGCYSTELVYVQWYTDSTWWQSLQFSLHSQSASTSASGIS